MSVCVPLGRGARVPHRWFGVCVGRFINEPLEVLLPGLVTAWGVNRNDIVEIEEVDGVVSCSSKDGRFDIFFLRNIFDTALDGLLALSALNTLIIVQRIIFAVIFAVTAAHVGELGASEESWSELDEISFSHTDWSRARGLFWN